MVAAVCFLAVPVLVMTTTKQTPPLGPLFHSHSLSTVCRPARSSVYLVHLGPPRRRCSSFSSSVLLKPPTHPSLHPPFYSSPLPFILLLYCAAKFLTSLYSTPHPRIKSRQLLPRPQRHRPSPSLPLPSPLSPRPRVLPPCPSRLPRPTTTTTPAVVLRLPTDLGLVPRTLTRTAPSRVTPARLPQRL
jgi:hypothetical protein